MHEQNKLIRIEKSGDSQFPKLIIERDFNADNANEYYTLLKEYAQIYPQMTLEIIEPASFDLSAIQLLQSFQQKMQDNLIIIFKFKQEFKTLLLNSGFDF